MATARRRGMTSAQKTTLAGAEQTSNKGQPNGYQPLNADGDAEFDNLFPPVGTTAEIAGITPAAGSIHLDTDLGAFVRGFNSLAGGVYIGMAGPSLALAPDCRTPSQSGTRMMALYDALKSATPNGSALSESNPAVLQLLPGVAYAMTAADHWDASHVHVLGAGQGGTLPTVYSDLTTTLGVGNASAAITTEVRRVRFVNVNAAVPSLTLIPNGLTKLTIEDCFFGLTSTSQAACNCIFGTGSLILIARKCRTLGVSLFGGVNTWTFNAGTIFEDCEGGSNSFGAGSSTSMGEFPGTLINCRMFGTSWNIKPNGSCVMDRVKTKAGIPRMVAGARFLDCTFDPSSGAALSNNSAVAIKTTGCKSSGAMLSTVTDDWGDGTLENIGTGIW